MRYDGDEVWLPGGLRDVRGMLRRHHVPDRHLEHSVWEERGGVRVVYRRQDVSESSVRVPLWGRRVCRCRGGELFHLLCRLRLHGLRYDVYLGQLHLHGLHR